MFGHHHKDATEKPCGNVHIDRFCAVLGGMSAQAIVFQHVAMEGPARVALAAERAGLTLHTVKLFEGEAVPAVAASDVLVILGGPMGVSDIGDSRFPFLLDETLLLRERVASDAPTLGICLGAQLLAHAAGAPVYRNTMQAHGQPLPIIELGWGPVTFLNQATEPALAGLGAQQTVLHWHSDTFDLPARATLLACTDVCRQQAFRLGTKVFGLQFHCEADPAAVERWVVQDADYVRQALGPDGPGRVLADTAALTPRDRDQGDQLLDNIFRCMLGL